MRKNTVFLLFVELRFEFHSPAGTQFSEIMQNQEDQTAFP